MNEIQIDYNLDIVPFVKIISIPMDCKIKPPYLAQ